MWVEKEEEEEGNEETVISEEVTSTCPVFLVANSTKGWRPCLSEVTCSLCRVPVNTTFTLYGDVKKFDRHYTLKLKPGEGFYLDGDATSTISKVGANWVLHSRLHQEQWRLHNDSWPLGRRLWDFSHDRAVLTLASCNILQFSSNDGVCLPRARRCDGLKDYHDASDEQDCHNRLLRKELSYDASENPFDDRGEKGSVWLDLDILHIGKMKSEKGMSLIEGAFIFRWKDPRLNFVDLKLSSNFFPCNDIWIPNVLGMAGSGYTRGPVVEFERRGQFCYVGRNKNIHEVRDLDDSSMGKYTRFLLTTMKSNI